MSTVESNIKNQPIISTPASTQPVIPPPLLLPTTAPLTPTTSLTPTTPLPSSPASFYDDKQIEKFYKKEKQIHLEFEQIVKGIEILI
jgi:hypothetical protein